jgi:hypothetical protein
MYPTLSPSHFHVEDSNAAKRSDTSKQLILKMEGMFLDSSEEFFFIPSVISSEEFFFNGDIFIVEIALIK